MRVREMKFSDYGVSMDRVQELLILARMEENQELLRDAAERSCPGLSDCIVKALVEKMGYYKLCSWVEVPATKSDFYAYRRKTLAIFNRLLIAKGKIPELCKGGEVVGRIKRTVRRRVGRRTDEDTGLTVLHLQTTLCMTSTHSAKVK